MLVVTLGGNSITARLCFTRNGDIALEYLMRGTTYPHVGAVAVEEYLIVLRKPWLLLELPLSVRTTAKALICS